MWKNLDGKQKALAEMADEVERVEPAESVEVIEGGLCEDEQVRAKRVHAALWERRRR